MEKFKLSIISAFLLLLWGGVTIRIEVFLLIVVVSIFSFIPEIRTSKKAYCIVLLIAFALPFSPIALTFINAEGPPKLIGYCNVRVPILDSEIRARAYQDQKNGKCIVASDLVTGFEAEKFIVW